MRTLVLLLSLILVSFQGPKKIKVARIYFAQNSSKFLEVNPTDKKTKATTVFNEFAKRVKSEDGGIKLLVCSNFDEDDARKLVEDRLMAVKDALMNAGVVQSVIGWQYPSVKVDIYAVSKKIIEAEKSDIKKDSLKALNRFVEIRYLMRAK